MCKHHGAPTEPQGRVFSFGDSIQCFSVCLCKPALRIHPCPSAFAGLPVSELLHGRSRSPALNASFHLLFLFSWLRILAFAYCICESIFKSALDPMSQLSVSFHPGAPYPLRSRAQSSCHSIKQGAFLKRYVYYAHSCRIQTGFLSNPHLSGKGGNRTVSSIPITPMRPS